MERRLELKAKGKYSEIEEAILAYVYEHPMETIGTGSLVSVLEVHGAIERGASSAPEVQRPAYEAVQFGIETLIKDKLVKGTRVGTPGRIEHTDLKLTDKGQIEAIEQKRRIKKIILDMYEKTECPRPPLIPDFGQDETDR